MRSVTAARLRKQKRAKKAAKPPGVLVGKVMATAKEQIAVRSVANRLRANSWSSFTPVPWQMWEVAARQRASASIPAGVVYYWSRQLSQVSDEILDELSSCKLNDKSFMYANGDSKSGRLMTQASVEVLSRKLLGRYRSAITDGLKIVARPGMVLSVTSPRVLHGSAGVKEQVPHADTLYSDVWSVQLLLHDTSQDILTKQLHDTAIPIVAEPITRGKSLLVPKGTLVIMRSTLVHHGVASDVNYLRLFAYALWTKNGVRWRRVPNEVETASRILQSVSDRFAYQLVHNDEPSALSSKTEVFHWKER